MRLRGISIQHPVPPHSPPLARWERAAFPLLLLAFTAILGSLAWRTGITVDEPAHLLSAHLYWIGQDNLYPGDMPPAIKIAGGWVSHFFALPVPYDDKPLWNSRIEWDIARVMMDRIKDPRLHRVFFYSRLPLLVFPVLTCVVLWWWARSLVSPLAALLLAAVFCLSPNVLGHGALFKNDLAASFGYLWFWYRAWRYWRQPDTACAAWLGAAMLAGVLAKLSLLILLPLGLLVFLARHVSLNARHWSRLLRHAALACLIFYLGTAAAWQFDFGLTPASEAREWKSRTGLPAWFSTAAQALRVIPTPHRMRQGAMSLVESNHDGVGVYLLGEVRPGGDPLYFLVALATKLTLPVQLLLCLGLLWIATAWKRGLLSARDLLWIIPPLLYLTLASLSSLQLGVRLVLPAIACFLLWCAQPMERMLRHRASAALLALMLLWLAGRSALQYPHYIAYFNSLAGGSDEGIRYLSDSNLDWGQDLGALAEYTRSHAIPKIRLAYFGSDNPYAYFTEERIERIAPPWSEDLVDGPHLRLSPGYYAVSSSLLTGQLFEPRFRDYYQALRVRKPLGKAGYSIFIYKVEDGESGSAGGVASGGGAASAGGVASAGGAASAGGVTSAGG
ncbi:MAG: hypothetical protein J0L64_19525 [Acidobacteria bacterium]|nr:hypothetical protein [Acidobacteriota bacterium]